MPAAAAPADPPPQSLASVPAPPEPLTTQQIAEHPVIKSAIQAFAERKPRGTAP